LAILTLALLLLVAQEFLNVNLEKVDSDLSLQRAKKEAREIDDLEGKIKNLNKDLVFLDKVQQEQNRFSLFLEGLAEDVPLGIQIKNFSIDESRQVNLIGFALTREALLTFESTLENVSYVSNLDIPLSNFTKAVDINFNLSFTYVP
jgi:Tfp pilus assembly protein PilN